MLDTLDQVRNFDPVSPRRLHPAVPRDLETICLKCLHKDPARRYPDATELADDLKRFAAGEPVRARPISRLERWVKRAKRNPVAAGLTAGLWVVVIAAAVFGVWYHLRLQAERDLARAQRDRARYHFDMSMRSIEEMLTEVAEEDLALEPRAELKRKALLEKALAFYEELLKVEPDDPDLAWRVARAARRVGDIQRLLGRYPEALAAYDRALERLAPLEREPPPGTDSTREIADVHNYIGEVYRVQEMPAPAREAYQRALAIQEPALAAGRADYRQELSRTRYNLGIVARHEGQPAVAVAELTEAARLLDGLPAADAEVRHHRARIYVNLASARLENRELTEADRACRQAIDLFDALVADSGGRPDFRYERAVAAINLGLVRRAAGDPAGARAELDGARGVLDRLGHDFPRTPRYKIELAQTYNALAAVAFDDQARTNRAAFDALAVVGCQVGSATEAAAMSGLAADIWAGLIADRGTPGDHGELGIALGNQGLALERLRRDEARALLTRGLTELLVGMRTSPDDPGFRASLRRQTRAVAGLLVRAGDHDAARGLARRIAAEPPDEVRSAHRAAALLAACLSAVERYKPAGADREVEGYVRLAVRLVTAAGPAAWKAVAADADCAPLVGHQEFAAALEK
jgi:tetratricopeptide (TPR) repeat protein